MKSPPTRVSRHVGTTDDDATDTVGASPPTGGTVIMNTLRLARTNALVPSGERSTSSAVGALAPDGKPVDVVVGLVSFWVISTKPGYVENTTSAAIITSLPTTTKYGGRGLGASDGGPAEQKLDREPWLKRIFAGYAFALEPGGQALHDAAAGTRVVHADALRT